MKGLEFMLKQAGNPFSPYELQFSAQERKAFFAEMIRELRKAKGYQQKEISEMLGITPQTYNGYETGRNEPPLEIIVRLSYLYNVPTDLLIQRERLHKGNESAIITLSKMDNEFESIKKQFKESPFANVQQLNSLMELFKQMIDATKTLVNDTDSKEQ